MRMKNLSNFFIGMLAMCALAGCSDNEVSGNEPGKDPGHPEDAVYMNVSIQLPGAGGSTRSETEEGTDGEYGSSTDGTEVGKDRENKVDEILLVLADKDDKFIATARRESFENPKGGVIRTTQCISKSILSRYYNEHGSNGTLNSGAEKIHIYVFCNPTEKLTDYFEGVTMNTDNWKNQMGTIVETSLGQVTTGADIWGGNKHEDGFLMSSATYKSVEKQIPLQFSDWEYYANKSNAFDFSGENVAGSSSIDNKGNIQVERIVARFDFKDGSKKGDQEYVFGENNAKQATLKVKLTKMALVNMSKNFYYLRRVSDDGLPNGNNFEICGTEYDNGTKANYVVDTDAETKNSYKQNENYKFGDYFNFCLGHQTTTPTKSWSIDVTARGQWYSQNIADVLKGEEDNHEGWNDNNNKGDYHIWRYVTENTIPGSEKQENGISTGIVFKGQILPTTGTPDDLKAVLESKTLVGNENVNDPILYYYANILYVRWTQVREEAIKAGLNTDLYKAAFGDARNEPKHNADPNQSVYSDAPDSPDYLWRVWQTTTTGQADALKKFKKAATTAGFTLYQASKEGNDEKVGYYCYYFYWNRHNDNGNNGVMGPMEFAVVRNNVYKLSVKEISRLGHPRISENDPDPVKPENPDEKEDVYLKLSVEVLPWVVRVNDIEF